MKIYTDYEKAWGKMIELCSGAKESILFEQFILMSFEGGEIGREFLDVFIRKAREGVQVKVLLDAFGSNDIYLDQSLQDELKKAGVDLTFTDIRDKRSFKLIKRAVPRNHRKLLVVDGSHVALGGVVIGEEFRSWDDIQVFIHDREFAKSSTESFDGMWGGEDVANVNGSNLLANSLTDTEITKEVFKKCTHANDRIDIITPYFSPPSHFKNLLFQKSREGLKIRVLIPKESDSILSSYATKSYIKPLIENDIEVYLYDKTMLHAKFVRADGWVTWGSLNFDWLSMEVNYELNGQGESKHFEDTIETLFSRSQHITKGSYSDFFSLLERFAHRISVLIRYFA